MTAYSKDFKRDALKYIEEQIDLGFRSEPCMTGTRKGPATTSLGKMLRYQAH